MRCVKCTENHLPGQCKLNSADNTVKPKCINCKGEHAANNATECPHFKRAIENKKNQNTNKETGTQKTAKKSTTQGKSSYATTVKKNSNKNTKQSENTKTTNGEQGYDINEMVKCFNENQKAMNAMIQSLVKMQKSMSQMLLRNG